MRTTLLTLALALAGCSSSSAATCPASAHITVGALQTASCMPNRIVGTGSGLTLASHTITTPGAEWDECSTSGSCQIGCKANADGVQIEADLGASPRVIVVYSASCVETFSASFH